MKIILSITSGKNNLEAAPEILNGRQELHPLQNKTEKNENS
ncbi:hypothetical protein [Metabacillus idriensis]|nr:hypothetical protein [Metabacillus idriensis]